MKDTRRMATPKPLRLPVGFQARSPMAHPLKEVDAWPSLSSCFVYTAAAVVFLIAAYVFAVLVL